MFGGYFYLKNDKPKFNEPNNLDGWINLCNEDLNFFEELEATNELEKQNSKRQKILESILNRCEKEKISCIGQKYYQSCQSVLKVILKQISLTLIYSKNCLNTILLKLFQKKL